jgi:hypothetical protein
MLSQPHSRLQIGGDSEQQEAANEKDGRSHLPSWPYWYHVRTNDSNPIFVGVPSVRRSYVHYTYGSLPINTHNTQPSAASICCGCRRRDDEYSRRCQHFSRPTQSSLYRYRYVVVGDFVRAGRETTIRFTFSLKHVLLF